MIDTTAPVIHDCQCMAGLNEWANDHEVYRGFIVHRWGRHHCILPIEMPAQDAADIIGRQAFYGHNLGTGEEVNCIPVYGGIKAVYALIDRFWENLGR